MPSSTTTNPLNPLSRTFDDLDHGRRLDGVLLDADAVRVLLCDSNVHRVVTDGGSTILDDGRATPTTPPPLFTALSLRDGPLLARPRV